MKKIFFSLLLTAFLTGAACAGMSAAQHQAAIALPQPCTIAICAVGIALYGLTHRRHP